MPAQPAASQPQHPLPAMTTYELRDHRRELEQAINSADPGAPVHMLRQQLDAVLAEQDDRARLATGA